MRKITRKEFVSRLSRKLKQEYKGRLSWGYTYWDLYWIIKVIYECMTDVLREGNQLYVADCFTLQPKYKKEKIAENFGHPCVGAAHYVPFMKPLTRWKEICRGLSIEDVEGRSPEKEEGKADGKDNQKY